MQVDISGTCAAPLSAVKDAFAANFAQNGDVGASVAVVKDGELMPAVRELAAELLRLPQKAATRTKHFVDGIFIGPRLY